MRRAIRMMTLIALVPLTACPDEKPIDLSNVKKGSTAQMPAKPEPGPAPRMPEGPLPLTLPTVWKAPPLLFAPQTVIFDRRILRKPTTTLNPYTGEVVEYVRAISATPVGVAGKLDTSAGDIALFVNSNSGAIDTLYLLDEMKISHVVMAVETKTRRGQLPYAFGTADPTVRDRVQIDLSYDEIAIGDGTVTGAFDTEVVEFMTARHGLSTIGIEARIGVHSGVSNERLADLLAALGAAKVEAVNIVPVTDSVAHSSTGTRYSGGVPMVRIGQPNAQGDLDKAIIRRYIKRNIQKIQYCYEKELLAQPNLSGTVSTQFFIKPDGVVASSSGSGVSPQVSSCVANVIKSIEFPKPKGGGGVQVNYPFTFATSGG